MPTRRSTTTNTGVGQRTGAAPIDQSALLEEERRRKEAEQAAAAQPAAPEAGAPELQAGREDLATALERNRQLAAQPRAAAPQITPTTIDPGAVSRVTAETTSQQALAQEIGRRDVRNVTAGQIAGSQFEGNQANLIAALEAQASGQAPSIAELQAKRAGEQALAQQLGLAAGATGAGAALARRTAATQQARIGADIAATSAQARLQEQQQAQQLLGQNIQAARNTDAQIAMAQQESQLQADLANQGVDLAVEKANAAAGNAASLANLKAHTLDLDRQLQANLANQGVDLQIAKQNVAAGNQAELANLQAQLQVMGMDDQMAMAYLQNEIGLSQAQIQAALQEQGIAKGVDIAGIQAAAQREQARRAATSAERSAILGGIGALGGAVIASDENLKHNIETKSLGEVLAADGPDRLDDFLSKLNVSHYDYKDEKFGKGRQTSVMAQELEQSDIGKRAVIETPEGKMVNYASLLPSMLSANVQNHKRIETLERALKAKSKKGK